MKRNLCLPVLCAVLLWSSLPAVAASVSVSQTLNPGWNTGYCSSCKNIATKNRYFASFDLQFATTLSEAEFAIREIPMFGMVASSFSVSIWSAPIDGELLYEAFFDPGDYTRVGLNGRSVASGYIELSLPDWFLRPGEYWISLFAAPGASIAWGGDGTLGDDAGYSLVNGEWVLKSNPHLGFSLGGRAGSEDQSWHSESAGEARPDDVGNGLEGRQGMMARTDVEAVPIGGTLPLLLPGLASLGLVRRRQRESP